MTYLEKYMKLHPDCEEGNIISTLCPGDVFEGAPTADVACGNGLGCPGCWDREIPEEPCEIKNIPVKTEGCENACQRDPFIEMIVDIENILLHSDAQWNMSYNPSTKSYSIYIAREENAE